MRKVEQELQQKKAELIWCIFRKLDFSLTGNGSEDEKLSIKDIPDIEVEDLMINTTSSSDEQERKKPKDDEDVTKMSDRENRRIIEGCFSPCCKRKYVL